MADWRFYGRTTELDGLTAILRRNRWFFAKITGRRRIGKTTLVQQAIAVQGATPLCTSRFLIQVTPEFYPLLSTR
jgi:hypothetical protein